MKTRIFETREYDIKKAAEILKNGGLVAFPTETVYGLGANAFDEEAVKKVYEAKGRPSDNPMIVHIGEASDISKLTNCATEDMKKLMEAFWPGPMTMVVPAKNEIPRITTGGLDTVAVRLPNNDITRKLIKESGVMLVGPSANLSGHPSPTTAAHVYDDLHGRIDAIIQGDACQVGIESTVVDMTGDVPIILRPGFVTPEEISKVLGKEVALDPAIVQRPIGIKEDGLVEMPEDYSPKAPGMKYKHYAPKAEMIIFEGEPEKVRLAMAEEKMENEAAGKKVGILIYDSNNSKEAAKEFFSQLRAFDKSDVDIILASAVKEDGVGLALMNRMFKSAGYNIRKIK